MTFIRDILRAFTRKAKRDASTRRLFWAQLSTNSMAKRRRTRQRNVPRGVVLQADGNSCSHYPKRLIMGASHDIPNCRNCGVGPSRSLRTVFASLHRITQHSKQKHLCCLCPNCDDLRQTTPTAHIRGFRRIRLAGAGPGAREATPPRLRLQNRGLERD